MRARLSCGRRAATTAPAPGRRAGPETHLAAALLAIGSAAIATQAAAQPSLSASLTSNYLYRGYSLSAERPATVATLSYDHRSGAYASASAIGTLTRHDGARLSGYQAYAGYARRFDADSSWEVGVSGAEVTQYYQQRYRVRYQEAYAGIATRRLSAHLYYSPNYLGEHTATVYATTTATLVPRPDWKLFGQAGVLVPVARKPTGEIHRSQYDVSLGVGRRVRDVELQAIVSRFGPDTDLAGGQAQRRTAVSVSATYFF